MVHITTVYVRVELGELITGSRPGRDTPEQITPYESVRVAVQDAAATGMVIVTVD